MTSPATTLAQVVADLDRLLGADSLENLPEAERLAVLQAAGAVQRRVDAVIVETLAPVDDTGGFASRAGCRSANELLQRALLTDSATAARYTRAARLIHRDSELTTGSPLPGRWPALHRALHDGAIGLEGLLAATGPIEQAGPRVGTDDRWAADALLAGQARGVIDGGGEQGGAGPAPAPTPEDLRVRAQVIVAYLDSDGAEPDFDRAARSRGVRLGPAKDGLVPIGGRLLPEAAGQLQRLWDAYLNPSPTPRPCRRCGSPRPRTTPITSPARPTTPDACRSASPTPDPGPSCSTTRSWRSSALPPATTRRRPSAGPRRRRWSR